MHFSEGGKSEISNLEVHVVVNQNVFKLQVSVHDALSVHVLEDIAHLVEEEASAVLAHASKGLAHIEKETSGDELEKDVNKVLNLSSRGLYNLSVRAISDNLDNILMF